MTKQLQGTGKRGTTPKQQVPRRPMQAGPIPSSPARDTHRHRNHRNQSQATIRGATQRSGGKTQLRLMARGALPPPPSADPAGPTCGPIPRGKDTGAGSASQPAAQGRGAGGPKARPRTGGGVQEGSPREGPEQRTRCLHRDSTEGGPGKTLPKPSSAPSGGRGGAGMEPSPALFPSPPCPAAKRQRHRLPLSRRAGFLTAQPTHRTPQGPGSIRGVLNLHSAPSTVPKRHSPCFKEPNRQGSEERRQDTAGTPCSQQ